MKGRQEGRRLLRPSFHLHLLAFTLTIFFGQIPLGVFAAQSPLDSTAHVLLPAAATSLLYDALYRRVVHSSTQYFCTMVLLGVTAEMFWEVLEFLVDAAFGLSWQVDNADTMKDILCGIVGATLGAGIRLWIFLRVSLVDALVRASTAGRRVGSVGMAVGVALALPGYAGYLAWAMPAAPVVPAAVHAPSIAAALVPAVTPDPVVLERAAVPRSTPGPRSVPAVPGPAVAAPSVPIPSLGAPVPPA